MFPNTRAKISLLVLDLLNKTMVYISGNILVYDENITNLKETSCFTLSGLISRILRIYSKIRKNTREYSQDLSFAKISTREVLEKDQFAKISTRDINFFSFFDQITIRVVRSKFEVP